MDTKYVPTVWYQNPTYTAKLMAASERDMKVLEFLRDIGQIEHPPEIAFPIQYDRSFKSFVRRIIRRTLDSTVELPIMPPL